MWLKPSLLQPHGGPQQHLQHAPARHHHGGAPLLHRLYLHDLPVTQAQPQHLRGLSGAISKSHINELLNNYNLMIHLVKDNI